MRKLFIAVLSIGFVLFAVSCNMEAPTTTTPTIYRTVIGTVQTIDSYSDYSVLHFGDNTNIDITNSSLSNWRVADAFGHVSTYQLQGVGMVFDDGYHEFNLVGLQINGVDIGRQ